MGRGQPAVQAPASRHRRRSVNRLRWLRLRVRDWRVRTKMAAVLVIPAVAFAVVAGVQTTASVQRAEAIDKAARQIAVGRQITALIHELQAERDLSVGALAQMGAAGPRDPAALADELAPQRQAVDRARAAFHQAADPLADATKLRAAYQRATAALGELDRARAGVQEGWLRQRAVFDAYSGTIDALLGLLPEPSEFGDDPVLAAQVRGVVELSRAKEAAAQVRGRLYAVLCASAFAPGDLAAVSDIRASRQVSLDRFRAAARPEQVARYDEVVRGQVARTSEGLERTIIDRAQAASIGVAGTQWWAVSSAELDLLRLVEAELLDQVVDGARQLSTVRLRETLLASVAVLAVLVIALLLSVVIGRSMANALRQLRAEALEIAQHRLPESLERLRRAGPGELEVALQPVAVRGNDEIGEVADAFTAVHRSALRLAAEQAAMRRNVNAIFVNLARRSQVLVERQLELLDELELMEEDPDQLANLFKLDHLATRMRRNDENLLVLAGSEGGRRRSEPLSLAGVVLAAVAEIEQYERVRHEATGDIYVVGHAVADIVHLLAELLENATTFSPPDTPVRITGQGLRGGQEALIEIADQGIGLSATALHEANTLLANPPPVDVAASERMGLFVVSHLAARHNVMVRLNAGNPGVVATVRLPGALLSLAPRHAMPAEPRAPHRRTRPATPLSAAPGSGIPVSGVPLLGVPVSGAPVYGSPALGGPVSHGPVASGTVPNGHIANSSALHASVSRGPLSAVPPGGWWSRPASPSGAEAPPEPPITGGTTPQGLPLRVPMAQLPFGTVATPPPAIVHHEPDPEEAGSMLSALYGGIRRAEAEYAKAQEETAAPAPARRGRARSTGTAKAAPRTALGAAGNAAAEAAGRVAADAAGGTATAGSSRAAARATGNAAAGEESRTAAGERTPAGERTSLRQRTRQAATARQAATGSANRGRRAGPTTVREGESTVSDGANTAQ